MVSSLAPPVCIGVHAVFADNASEELLAAGARRVVTCNTIPHVSSVIDLTELLLNGVGRVRDSCLLPDP